MHGIGRDTYPCGSKRFRDNAVDPENAIDMRDVVALAAQPVADGLGAHRAASRGSDVLVGGPPAGRDRSDELACAAKVNRWHGRDDMKPGWALGQVRGTRCRNCDGESALSAIWKRDSDEWKPLLPSGFANEDALHDLVEEAPHLLPLSGDPTLVVVGREVALGSGFADLVAVETDGRLAVIEIKLRRNAEARRAVVAQILMYAAYLRGLDAEALEREVLASHISRRPFRSLIEAAREADQTGDFEEHEFAAALGDCLATGAFRLVLVLDEAPAELVQLVGYLESISAGVILDLITVSTYEVGDEQILVPQRVDPEHAPDVPTVASSSSSARSSRTVKPKPIDGSEPFAEAIERTEGEARHTLARLLAWARDLETGGLATLKSVLGDGRQILLVWLPGEKAGLVSIWNDNGAYVSLWRSVFARHAWERIEPIEAMTGKPMGQGSTISSPDDELLDVLAAAYQDAQANDGEWDGRTYYVSFGEGPERSWDDARNYGFVSAGGGAWYSKTLRQLKAGNRVFAYIPKGNGVGGYVGVGEVTGPAVLAQQFMISKNGHQAPLTDVALADMTHGGTEDPEQAEWVIPVRWAKAVPRDEALKDSDFFANQNSAVRLTHGYTLKRLRDQFGINDPA